MTAPRSDAFDFLRECWQSDRAVIPLLGSGLSVSAGVPSGGQIYADLRRLEDSYEGSQEELRTTVEHHGWPDRHEVLVRELIEQRRAVSTSRAARSSNAPRPPEDWTAPLYRITDKRGLHELLFANLVGRRLPSANHHFIGFLGKVFNWRLILTTNFDELLESALRAQGIPITVFEVQESSLWRKLAATFNAIAALHSELFDSESGVRSLGATAALGHLPHPMLVRGLPSVPIIKMHGSTHRLSLTTGDRNLMTDEEIGRYFDCFPKSDDGRRPVLLVIGCSPREQRIVDFAHRWNSAAPDECNVVWVYRSKPPTLQDAWTVPANDPIYFLHELHQRLLVNHPAALQPYSALYRSLPAHSRASNEPVEGSMHAAYKKDANSPYERRLWINLYEATSLGSFLAQLVEALLSVDLGLPMVARPALAAAYEEHTYDRLLPFIATALRRSTWLIVVSGKRGYRNSVATATTLLNGADSDGDRVALQRKRRATYDFLRSLSTLELGGSRIYLSPAIEDMGLAWLKAPSADSKQPYELNAFLTIFYEPHRSAEAEGELTRRMTYVYESPYTQCVAKAAAAFRRPRSFVGLMKVASWLLVTEKEHAHLVSTLGTDREREVDAYGPLYREVAQAIGRLEEGGWLEAQEGGFYLLTSENRSILFDKLAVADCVELHDRIAEYYCAELYEHSRDPRAFFEYAFHRMASCSASQPDAQAEQRLSWLVAAFERESNLLIASGHAAELIDVLEQLHERVRQWPPLHARTLRLRVQALRRSTYYKECIGLHRAERGRQGVDRIQRSFDKGYCLSAIGSRDEWPLERPGKGPSLDRGTKWLQAALRDSQRQWKEAKEAFPDDLVRSGLLQQISVLKALTKRETRTLAPWEWRAPMATDAEGLSLPERLKSFDEAIEILRSLGPSTRIHSLQCSIRCNRARALYLAGKFDKANAELNRAHGFGVHASGPEDRDALAEYHLHRAEYCLFRSMHIHEGDRIGLIHSLATLPGRSEATTHERAKDWLITAARHALAGAESQLRLGERSATRWLWFYILRTWLSRQALQRLPATASQANNVGELAMHGLRGVAGAFLNVSPGSTAELAVESLWADLRTEWMRMGCSVARDSEWAALNWNAGLELFMTRMQARYKPKQKVLKLHVVGCQLPWTIVDLNGLGARVIAKDGLDFGREYSGELPVINGLRINTKFRLARLRAPKEAPSDVDAADHANLFSVVFYELQMSERSLLMTLQGELCDRTAP